MTVLPIFLVVASCVACEFVGAHLCAASCAAWAVNSLARCVPAVSEVVRAQRCVRLCAAFRAAL